MTNKSASDWPIPELIEQARSIKTWQKAAFVPTDALIPKDRPNVQRKRQADEEVDSKKYKLRESGWDHEHCLLRMAEISLYPGRQSEGYTDGHKWLCEACYKMYIRPGPEKQNGVGQK